MRSNIETSAVKETIYPYDYFDLTIQSQPPQNIMASEILYPTGIAAVNDHDRLRIYFQSPTGQIRERQYENN
ncbi:hypothetical protein BDW74DRAFT_182214 [Aspergillus multicolor]|uniref:uncharacterized protein n=1 Tax=Aspergillus multicolor TaxID=41759 RepID=UPI003CCCF732